MCLFNCKTRLLSENPVTVNVLTSIKNSWDLQKSTFILLFHHSEPSWVGKCYFQSNLRFLDCLITRWLETTIILVVIERIYRYQFKSNYLKHRKPLTLLFLNIWNLHEVSNALKKKKMNFIDQVFLNLLTSKYVLM